MEPRLLAWFYVLGSFVGFSPFSSKDSLGTKTKKKSKIKLNQHEYKELSQHSSGQNNVKGHSHTHTHKLNNVVHLLEFCTCLHLSLPWHARWRFSRMALQWRAHDITHQTHLKRWYTTRCGINWKLVVYLVFRRAN